MSISKALIVALLCAVACSLGTFTDQYNTTGTYDNDHELYPAFSLGYIEAGSQITLQIKINPTVSVEPLTIFLPQILLTGSWTEMTAFVVTSDTSILQAKFTIQGQSDQYKVRIINRADFAAYTYLHIFTLSAFVKDGNTSAPVTTIFKNYVDILRPTPIKYFYIQSNDKVANVTENCTQGTPVATDFQYALIDTANSTNLKGSFIALPANAVPEISGNLMTVIFTLTKGYHAIRYTVEAEARNFQLGIQSDPYPCPFPATSTDVHSTFPGCFHSTAGADTGNGAVFPCITVVNSTCTTCYVGYALVGTSCIYNPCNSDQFYSNSICTKASVSCLTFNRFTGVCLTCVNSNYTLLNGACNVNACPAGQTKRNNTCVSNTCNSFVLISGVCSSCINNAFELADGICTPVKCFSLNLYFSFAVQACTVLPNYCSSINFITEKCTACLAPFTLNASTSACQLICVAPQVKWLDLCVNLPQNCDAINVLRQCSKCKANFAIQAGTCQPTGAIVINNP